MLIWTDAVELNSGKFYFKRVQTDYERKNSTAMFCVSGIVTRLTICFDLTRKSAFPEPSLWSCMCSHHKFTAKAKYEIIFNVMRSNESQFCFPRCMLQLSWISFNDRNCSTRRRVSISMQQKVCQLPISAELTRTSGSLSKNYIGLISIQIKHLLSSHV